MWQCSVSCMLFNLIIILILCSTERFLFPQIRFPCICWGCLVFGKYIYLLSSSWNYWLWCSVPWGTGWHRLVFSLHAHSQPPLFIVIWLCVFIFSTRWLPQWYNLAQCYCDFVDKSGPIYYPHVLVYSRMQRAIDQQFQKRNGCLPSCYGIGN